MIKAILVAVSCISVVGCVSKQPTIESTKKWENHYFTVEEFKLGTDSIQLDKDESIWVMSNKTLNRLLKNIGK